MTHMTIKPHTNGADNRNAVLEIEAWCDSIIAAAEIRDEIAQSEQKRFKQGNQEVQDELLRVAAIESIHAWL